MKKFILRMIKYYIIWLIVFITVIALVEVILLNYVHGMSDFVQIFTEHYIEAFVIYTVGFVVVNIYIYESNKRLIRSLNEKLYAMKKRMEENNNKENEED